MKKLLVILFILSSTTAQAAGLFDWRYFEPAAGCLVAGGVSYAGSDADSRMKNAAISCAIGAGIGFLINSHYQSKYGQEFEARKEHYQERLQRFKMLEKQAFQKEDPGAPYSIRRRVIPATRTGNGDLILPSVQETIIIKDSNDRVGQ